MSSISHLFLLVRTASATSLPQAYVRGKRTLKPTLQFTLNLLIPFSISNQAHVASVAWADVVIKALRY